jgi:hypothetical protein
MQIFATFIHLQLNFCYILPHTECFDLFGEEGMCDFIIFDGFLDDLAGFLGKRDLPHLLQ